MKVHIDNVQIIKQGGKAAFAVIPFDEYLKLTGQTLEPQVYIPHEVAEIALVEEVSLMAAWRKHLGLSQADLAEKMGVNQSAVSQMEKMNSKPQRKTLERAADAMKITVEQLTDSL